MRPGGLEPVGFRYTGMEIRRPAVRSVGTRQVRVISSESIDLHKSRPQRLVVADRDKKSDETRRNDLVRTSIWQVVAGPIVETQNEIRVSKCVFADRPAGR